MKITLALPANVAGCPHCKGMPELTENATHDPMTRFTLECLAYPDHPVYAKGESIAAVIEQWKDAEDWIRLGAQPQQ